VKYIIECTEEGKFGTREYNRAQGVKIKQWLLEIWKEAVGKLLSLWYILPGMTVISDCWGAYRTFEENGGQTLGKIILHH
jgi:hypothetical protein